MMCLKTYKVKGKGSFDNFIEWVDFVNENYKHAITKSKTFDWIGKCVPSELPSFHPYYKYLIKKRNRNELIRLGLIYKECVNDESRIKFHFNLTTSLEDIEDKIMNLNNKL